jgi:hypothetical protein
MASVQNRALCERARSWAALAPDHELSELEDRLLDSHLARCAACSDFAAQVAGVADVLRSEPLQPLTYPIAVPSWRRRAVFARVRTVTAAAAVAAMAIGIAARAPLPSDGHHATFHPPGFVPSGPEERAELDEMRDLRRTILIAVDDSTASRHFGDQPA